VTATIPGTGITRTVLRPAHIDAATLLRSGPVTPPAPTPHDAVVIVDRIPAFTAGLAAILAQDGFEPLCCTEPEAVLRHRPDCPPVATIATVDSAADLTQLAALRDDRPGLVLVAVLMSTEPAEYLGALRSGISAVVDWRAGAADIVQALCAALAGHTVLPTPVARSLAATAPQRSPAARRLSSDDVRWLRMLAKGGSVARLARSEGYSQREIFRRLSSVYKRMGANSRPEAIALAGRWGLLAGDDTPT
jgi:DNA-binding NarL/FixJ family response regulator